MSSTQVIEGSSCVFPAATTKAVVKDQANVDVQDEKKLPGALFEERNGNRDFDSDDDDDFLLQYDPFGEARAKTEEKCTEEEHYEDEDLNPECVVPTKRRKLLNKLGFKSPIELHESMQQALSWYREVFDVLMMPDREYQLRFKEDEDGHDELVLRSPLKKKMRSSFRPSACSSP
jgi:hypothetical protein